jgi:hypothetical protein
MGTGHVGEQFADDPLLGAGQCKGQAVSELPEEPPLHLHGRCRFFRGARAQPRETQVMGHQFLEGETALGRVAPLHERGNGHIGRRAVHGA